MSYSPDDENEAEAEDRVLIKAVCRKLDKRNLVETLKWPFCVGEKQQLVLAVLEEKLAEEFPEKEVDFQGNVWDFVRRAEEFGFTRDFIDRPAVRPTAEDAIAELAAIQAKQLEK